MSAPDPQFDSLLADCAIQADKTAEYLYGAGTQRQWMIPAESTPGWTFDPTDIEFMGDPFDRFNLNVELSLIYSNQLADAKVGDITGRSIQISYMATMERAFRERHKLMTRAIAHRCGRAMAHSSVDGPHYGHVLDYVTTALDV